MSNIPNVPFTDGMVFTPELAYLAFNPIFDGDTQYLGHQPKLLDSNLSSSPGQILSRVANLTDGFKPTATSGLQVSIASGVYSNTQGVTVSIPTTLVSVPNNTTSFILINSLGNIVVQATPDTLRCMLAMVVTSGGAITTIQDLRDLSIREILPVPNAIKTFGGNNQTDKVCTQGEVLDQGIYYFRNFTVPEGITISISRLAKILAAGSVNIAGTINVTPIAQGGKVTALNVAAGLIAQGESGTGLGATGAIYPWGAQPYGSSGNSGIALSDSTTLQFGYTGAGGAAGGSLWIEAQGNITVSGSIFADGGAGTQGGSLPTYLNGQPVFQPGVGGGTVAITGAGGGSGGLVLLSSLGSVTVTGTITVRGGNGGDAFYFPASNTTQPVVTGGSGGGGGYIITMAPNVNTTGATLNLNGGISGNPAGTGITTVNANTWSIGSARGFWGAPVSAGFGGVSLTPTIVRSGGTDTYTRTTSQVGQLVNRTFSPVG